MTDRFVAQVWAIGVTLTDHATPHDFSRARFPLDSITTRRNSSCVFVQLFYPFYGIARQEFASPLPGD
jgi:hypothetical protein